jgi:hypothetical protein
MPLKALRMAMFGVCLIPLNEKAAKYPLSQSLASYDQYEEAYEDQPKPEIVAATAPCQKYRLHKGGFVYCNLQNSYTFSKKQYAFLTVGYFCGNRILCVYLPLL